MNSDDCVLIFESPVGVVALPVNAVHAARLNADELLGNSPKVASHHNLSTTITLVDANEIATIFGMDATWFLTRARENRIPHIRLGKYIRFDPDEIRDFFSRNSDRHANSEITHHR